MSLPIVICDDSSFARKAIARSLPDDWDVDINFAENGQKAIEQIEKGNAHVLFLDLNMPVMDGYETMKVIREKDLQTIVIVVSGDVQQEARKRMLAMGALEFIEKPINNVKLVDILRKFGIYEGEGKSEVRQKGNKMGNQLNDKLDLFRELCNVAMGQAGKNLAKLLDVFVDLPVPNISIVHSNELSMAIAEIDKNESVSALSKGFIGQGLTGEAIILFNDTHVQSLNTLLGYDKQDELSELETLMDISNIIVGACLTGIAKQLQLDVSHTTPIILGMHCNLEELVNKNISSWEELLMVEIAYSLPAVKVNFELLLLLPKDCLNTSYERLMLLGDAQHA
ncbi:MAG: chemotaxis protein CheY-P-specific phosphatase CheC [Yoonia sp.]|jgi:chemotaxis protein CheY-P-specific phosphatase CheC